MFFRTIVKKNIAQANITGKEILTKNETLNSHKRIQQFQSGTDKTKQNIS